MNLYGKNIAFHAFMQIKYVFPYVMSCFPHESQ